ncbi:helix-turn-helix domain-containing protein [Flavobacterium psychrotolerans]|uniref:AraC family transcriptional regulator n=1 Tax=Flavobacterium psychrotolerans TaxID=2169410 RepID=A0A2U1JH89_9FLAO|nr:helix-turn-helix domain-containing protein [Flavobacterium psychrotolerans]PWA04491.1 AraC family transcriptional regulator [Flavobacterium psychrotolerans]
MENIPIRRIKGIPKEPNLSGSFSIREIQELLEGKDMIQELHRHDFYYILVLEKGSGSHEIDFTSYEIFDYSIFLMRPGQVHQLNLKSGSSGYLLQFKTDFFYTQNKLSQELLRKVSHINFCSLNGNGFKRMEAILSYILKEYSEKQEGYQEVIKSNLSILFIELVRHRQNKKNTTNDTNQYSQEQLEKFHELLETHITKNKQVSQYADMLHISIYQLNAITKTLLNRTPSELINEHIVLESKRQLLATSNQVNQIADHLGYDDISYFIRFFKKHTNYSPEAFRNNFK